VSPSVLDELWAILRVMPKTINDNWLEMGPTPLHIATTHGLHERSEIGENVIVDWLGQS
jgi:hypothetical protein